MGNRLRLVSRNTTPSGIGELFEGVLDAPAPGLVLGSSILCFSGWINPKNENRRYTLKIVSATGIEVIVTPNVPRPDVVNRRKDVTPLTGDSDFFGFKADFPLSDTISVYVQIDNKEVLWQTISTAEIDFDVFSVLRQFLSKGQVSNSKLNKLELLGPEVMKKVVDIEATNTNVINPSRIPASLGAAEKDWFNKFIKYIDSADFLSRLLLSHSAESGIGIPSPFSSDFAVLVSTVFIVDANFLIFRYGNTHFYIGQYLHTLDFVYFPEKSLLLRFNNSHYEQRHLIALISHGLRNPKVLLKKLKKPANTILGGLILNGMSPYHFFYDCIPSLYAANKCDALKGVNAFFSIKGECYYPVEKLFNLEATNKKYTHIEFINLQAETDQFFIVAGASYKQLDALQVAEMDRQITCHAIASSPDEMTSVTNSLEGYYPVLWIGISAQKRSWINQNEALIKALQSIYAMHPNMAIIFDGMTSNIFKANADAQDFSKDHELVEAIKAMLPPKITAASTVGLNSQEKLILANAADFYIANYSTGSMYPARFTHLPGVAHLSKAMMSIVRDIHIHYKTFTVPDELITDIPDPDNNRLDFISYSIDEDAFSKYVCSVFESTIEDKTKPIATEGNL